MFRCFRSGLCGVESAGAECVGMGSGGLWWGGRVKRVVFCVSKRAVCVEVIEIVLTGCGGDNSAGRWGWLWMCDVGCVALEEDVMVFSHLAYREKIVFCAWHDDSMRDAYGWVIRYWNGRGALMRNEDTVAGSCERCGSFAGHVGLWEPYVCRCCTGIQEVAGRVGRVYCAVIWRGRTGGWRW